MNNTELEIIRTLTNGVSHLSETGLPGYMLFGRAIGVAKKMQSTCQMKVFRNPKKEGVMQCEYLVQGRHAEHFAKCGWVEVWINENNEFVEA